MSIVTILFFCAFNILSSESIALSVSVPNYNYVERPHHNEINISDKLADVIIDTAPQKVQIILESIQKNKSFNGLKRSLILTGETGTGKTYLAQAIAKKSGLSYQNVSVCALFHGYKSESQVLQELIEEWSSVNEPTIVVFDNIDFTRLLYEGLEKLKMYENVFFIGTTLNEISFKKEFYSEKRKHTVIKLINPDAGAREKILKYYLGNDHNLNDAYIKKLVTHMVDLLPRRIRSLTEEAFEESYFRCNKDFIEEIDMEKALITFKIKRSFFSQFWSATKKCALTLNQYIHWPTMGRIIACCIQWKLIKYNYDAQLNYQRELHQIYSDYKHNSYTINKH